jgi:uncharacterized membrane protein YeaQ/YmgE (transglycosylase-associated protein family)
MSLGLPPQPEEERTMEQQAGHAIGTIEGLLIVAVVGLVIGAIAKLLLPGKDPGGLLITMLLGIAGSFVGGFIGNMIGITSAGGAFVVSVIGAVLLLLLVRVVRRGSTA